MRRAFFRIFQSIRNPLSYLTLMYPIAIFLLLFGIWIIFSGQFDLFHLALGLISALFVTWISSSFLFLDRSRSVHQRLGEVIRIPGYLIWILYKIFQANIHILKLALTPGDLKGVEPSLVKIKTNLKTDFGRYVLANSITLTPGTITVMIEGDKLLVHSISEETAAGVRDGTMERRIADVFERRKE